MELGRPQIDYVALPNIIVTRNEAGKAGGYISLSENLGAYVPGQLSKRVIVEDLKDEVEDYTINGVNGNCYDLTLYRNSYFNLINIAEGQELIIICNVAETNPDDGTPPISLPVFLNFTASERIKWLDAEAPYVDTNCKITFYKSNNIIYAEIKRPYIGNADSGS